MSPQVPDEKRVNKRYLVKWKLALNLTLNNKTQTIYGNLADISIRGGTALLENTVPTKSTVAAIFTIPPKTIGAAPQTIQVNGKLIYCVLGNYGLFRAGLQFENFIDEGLAMLSRELAERIPLSI